MLLADEEEFCHSDCWRGKSRNYRTTEGTGWCLSCKANARVKIAKTGHGPLSSKLVVFDWVVLLLFVMFCCYCVVLLLFVLFCYYLCCSMYCLCVNVYCTTATVCSPICSWQIYQYQSRESCVFEKLDLVDLIPLVTTAGPHKCLTHMLHVKLHCFVLPHISDVTSWQRKIGKI